MSLSPPREAGFLNEEWASGGGGGGGRGRVIEG